MCGGGSPAPAPAPAPAPTPVASSSTASAGNYDFTNSPQAASEANYARKMRMGKRRMRIPTKNGATVPTDGSGLNIPQG